MLIIDVLQLGTQGLMDFEGNMIWDIASHSSPSTSSVAVTSPKEPSNSEKSSIIVFSRVRRIGLGPPALEMTAWDSTSCTLIEAGRTPFRSGIYRKSIFIGAPRWYARPGILIRYAIFSAHVLSMLCVVVMSVVQFCQKLGLVLLPTSGSRNERGSRALDTLISFDLVINPHEQLIPAVNSYRM